MLTSIGLNNMGFLQLIYILSNLKWILFILMGYRVLLTGDHKTVFIIILFTEFVLGFTGYFSSFKTPILYLLITYLTLKQFIQTREFATAIIFIALS